TMIQPELQATETPDVVQRNHVPIPPARTLGKQPGFQLEDGHVRVFFSPKIQGIGQKNSDEI
ncbi:hypothetical protein HispidOSU_006408, partial [Sigmodon hispidus]